MCRTRRSGSRSMAMLVRAHGAPEALVAPDSRRHAADWPDVRRVRADADAGAAAGDDMGTGILRRPDGGVCGRALLLACLGIYALISYSVGRRSREIGVRLALGARPADVIGMLLRQTAHVGGAGLVVGLILASASRAPSPAACTVSASTPWLFASMAVPLDGGVAAGDVGSGAPRRARRADDRAAGRVSLAKLGSGFEN